jgi:hypothetical protein
MIDDKQVIDKKLIEIRDHILQILDPNYYKGKVQNIQPVTLSLSVTSYNYELVTDLNSLPKISYLEQQISDLIDSLDGKFRETRFQNITPQLLSARSIGWNMIKGKLNEFQSDLSKLLNDDTENDDRFDDVVLLRDQVALLITYLRESKVITNSMSDIAVARCFHEMTGFSAEKLRQKLSGVAKSEHNQISDLESNYDKLKSVLESIIDQIEDDKRKAILKKAK